jgi:hypothetical protein
MVIVIVIVFFSSGFLCLCLFLCLFLCLSVSQPLCLSRSLPSTLARLLALYYALMHVAGAGINSETHFGIEYVQSSTLCFPYIVFVMQSGRLRVSKWDEVHHELVPVDVPSPAATADVRWAVLGKTNVFMGLLFRILLTAMLMPALPTFHRCSLDLLVRLFRGAGLVACLTPQMFRARQCRSAVLLLFVVHSCGNLGGL